MCDVKSGLVMSEPKLDMQWRQNHRLWKYIPHIRTAQEMWSAFSVLLLAKSEPNSHSHHLNKRQKQCAREGLQDWTELGNVRFMLMNAWWTERRFSFHPFSVTRFQNVLDGGQCLKISSADLLDSIFGGVIIILCDYFENQHNQRACYKCCLDSAR